jgi:leader peptidase (prepilin peptidase)/N-methyltransferase
MTARTLTLAAVGATVFALAAAYAGADALALARLTLCGAAVVIAAAVDLAEHRVPNRLVLPAAAGCAALTVASGARFAGLVWALALVALLLAVSLARPAALGMGDVKLALLIAVGLDGRAPAALTLGLLLAALGGIVLLVLRGRSAWRRSLPLAPFLAGGVLAALLL